MTRTVLRAALLLTAMLGITSGLMAQETKTLTGEIVDPASYLKDGRPTQVTIRA